MEATITASVWRLDGILSQFVSDAKRSQNWIPLEVSFIKFKALTSVIQLDTIVKLDGGTPAFLEGEEFKTKPTRLGAAHLRRRVQQCPFNPRPGKAAAAYWRSNTMCGSALSLDSQFLSSEEHRSRDSSPISAPPTPDDISRWQCHMSLQHFGESLQAAAEAVFPNRTKPRYSKVFALILSWEDEDPNLPVHLEIEKLEYIFRDLYGLQTEVWKIPNQNSHVRVNQKIIDLITLEDNPEQHLFVVYYAGHATLTRDRLLAWTESDVLILLDCCHSGTATASEGNGVTELISACAYNSQANGVGSYSFTKELIIELGQLSQKPSFTVAELYRNIFCRIQSRRPEDEDRRERHPAPVHLSLTQDHPRFPRSIQISARPRKAGQVGIGSAHEGIPISSTCANYGSSLMASTVTISSTVDDLVLEDDSNSSLPSVCAYNSSERKNSVDGIAQHSQYLEQIKQVRDDTGEASKSNDSKPSPASGRIVECGAHNLSSEDIQDSIRSVESTIPTFSRADVPRILLAIRLEDSVSPENLSVNLIKEWFRNVPLAAEEVKVEAGFGSFSSILIISLPIMLSIYIPKSASIINIGPITTPNLWERSNTDNIKVVDAARDLVHRKSRLGANLRSVSTLDLESNREAIYSYDLLRRSETPNSAGFPSREPTVATKSDSQNDVESRESVYTPVASATTLVDLVSQIKATSRTCSDIRSCFEKATPTMKGILEEVESIQNGLQAATVLMDETSTLETRWNVHLALSLAQTFERTVNGLQIELHRLKTDGEPQRGSENTQTVTEYWNEARMQGPLDELKNQARDLRLFLRSMHL
ncbi:hypothetical protein N431DRAFT_483980 [Stipitochalara longipes BDJ]|nr:hypothetical protein N431DRAFT_483980 [Stipitochalara longipes BDJ]